MLSYVTHLLRTTKLQAFSCVSNFKLAVFLLCSWSFIFDPLGPPPSCVVCSVTWGPLVCGLSNQIKVSLTSPLEAGVLLTFPDLVTPCMSETSLLLVSLISIFWCVCCVATGVYYNWVFYVGMATLANLANLPGSSF